MGQGAIQITQAKDTKSEEDMVVDQRAPQVVEDTTGRTAKRQRPSTARGRDVIRAKVKEPDAIMVKRLEAITGPGLGTTTGR